jgi:phosphate starvation-inducible protein PhoH
MKKNIRVDGNIGEFFGTHDANVKYLESLLKVQILLQDDTLTIDGPDEKVVLVERLISDYLQLRSEGCAFQTAT